MKFQDSEARFSIKLAREVKICDEMVNMHRRIHATLRPVHEGEEPHRIPAHIPGPSCGKRIMFASLAQHARFRPKSFCTGRRLSGTDLAGDCSALGPKAEEV